jgi:Fe2+ or Zn2+ uptake regulation protein
MSDFTAEVTLALTEPQRLVLDTLQFSWDVLAVKRIHKRTKGKVSVKTIRRALAKLVDMGIIECLPAERKGRGYSNLYRLASSKDEEKVRQEKEKEEIRDEGDPLSELDDLLARYKKAERTK